MYKLAHPSLVKYFSNLTVTTSLSSKRFPASSFRKLAGEQQIGVKVRRSRRGEKEGLLPFHYLFFCFLFIYFFFAISNFRAII